MEPNKSSVPIYPSLTLWQRLVNWVTWRFPTEPPPQDAKEALRQSMKF